MAAPRPLRGNTWHDRDDPGLQPERTKLSWQRTMLGFLAAGLVLLRWTAQLRGLVLAMVLVTCCVAAYLLVRMQRRTAAVAPTFPDRPIAVAIVEVCVLVASTTLLGLIGLWIILTT